jgi:polyisoprenoid-binding protein YceI
MPWEYDKNHSLIGFTARHLGISTVHGRFDDVEVSLDLDSEDPTKWKVSATIKAVSINTGIGRRDDTLRAAPYFDVEQFPMIQFTTTRVEPRGDAYVVIGNLTMRDVTKEVELAAIFNGEAVDREITKRGFSAQGAVDRFAFGVGDPKPPLNTAAEIKLILEMEAIKK